LDAANVTSSLVVGHSMGAFVSLALAYLYPERVSRLLLIDGGLPLDVPAGLDTDTLVAAILGPTAVRLSRRFASVDDYLDFW
ncbi:alpha/beta fold hydrolase, partial [Acinetobacter baumannii]